MKKPNAQVYNEVLQKYISGLGGFGGRRDVVQNHYRTNLIPLSYHVLTCGSSPSPWVATTAGGMEEWYPCSRFQVLPVFGHEESVRQVLYHCSSNTPPPSPGQTGGQPRAVGVPSRANLRVPANRLSNLGDYLLPV